MISKIFSVLIAILFSFFASPVHAQSEIVGVYDISDTTIKDGDIVSFTPDQQIQKTSREYDLNIFGVVQNNPLVVYKRVDQSGTPVVRSGTVEVNVSTLNGPIKAGDYITSSEIPGVGKKADISGYVVGKAINSFTEQDREKVGKVQVAVKIEFAELTVPKTLNRLFSYLGISFLQSIQDPKGFGQSIKYIFAGLIVLIAIAFSLIILLRSIPKSIEAIGRNPLARTAINLSIAMNVFISVAITAGAIFAAFIIIKI